MSQSFICSTNIIKQNHNENIEAYWCIWVPIKVCICTSAEANEVMEGTATRLMILGEDEEHWSSCRSSWEKQSRTRGQGQRVGRFSTKLGNIRTWEGVWCSWVKCLEWNQTQTKRRQANSHPCRSYLGQYLCMYQVASSNITLQIQGIELCPANCLSKMKSDDCVAEDISVMISSFSTHFSTHPLQFHPIFHFQYHPIYITLSYHPIAPLHFRLKSFW